MIIAEDLPQSAWVRAVLAIPRLQTRWAKDTRVAELLQDRDTTMVQTKVLAHLCILNTTLSMLL